MAGSAVQIPRPVDVLGSRLLRQCEVLLERHRAGQYWIVDPRDETMDVYVKDEGWALVAHLDRGHPATTVQVPHDVSGISVELDLAVILTGG